MTLDDAQAFVRTEGIRPRRPELLGLATVEGGPGSTRGSGDGTDGAPEHVPRPVADAAQFE